jgi:hypothetical protein
MIRKSGNRFSEKVMLHQKNQHDPEKWKPVFRKDHAPPKNQHDPEKWKPVFRKDHAQTKSQSGMMTRSKVIPF